MSGDKQEKINIVDELIKNTMLANHTEHYIELFLKYRQSLVKGEVLLDRFDEFDKRIEYILSESFDIEGWMLWEIPIEYCHVYRNIKVEQWFDLNLFGGKVTPSCLINSNETDVTNIAEAISSYSI